MVTIREAIDYVAIRARRKIVSAVYTVYFSIFDESRPVNESAQRDALSDVDSVLFLCHGNVCRSPFAERYMVTTLEERGIDGIDVDSAGMSTTQGRSSPETAIEVADGFGVDLRDHGAIETTMGAIEAADVVFVMDANNYEDVRRAFPDQRHKTFFLAATESNSGVTIDDPYEGEEDTFRSVYGRIADAIDRVVDELDQQR
ncbi:MAG: low molecular weight phosphotyrosine protein phosphatase [Halodesulfurarchaeum sp.]